MTKQLPAHVEDLLRRRYYLKGDSYEGYYKEPGKETMWPEVAKRVATVVGTASGNVSAYEKLLLDMDFLPNSPTLFGAGVPGLCLSACFVVKLEDSIDGWGDAIKNGIKIQTMGGGLGWPLHNLRPEGFAVKGKQAKAAGPIAFMKGWNTVSLSFSQAVRDGANMGMMKIDHPDIMKFVNAKVDDADLSGFNISVGATDKFMKALDSETGDFDLLWDGKVVTTIDARVLFNTLCERAWKNGDPGLLFYDTIQAGNLHPEEGDLAVNPCAEATIPEDAACNLGSINLANFVKEDGTFDYARFERVIRTAFTFLDDLIDVNNYPTEAIREQVLKFRQVGLGVMGFATALIKMGIRYGDAESFTFANNIFLTLEEITLKVSKELAESRGAYPVCKDGKLRNSMRTTVAPTGSISMIACVSSAIEPYFSFEPIERLIMGEKVIITTAPGELTKYTNVTANELSAGIHIKMAAIAQSYITMSISKTINMPNGATVEDVKDAYMLAYRSGLKGITVYRDGSREVQVLTKAGTDPRRPERLRGETNKVPTSCGNLYVTLNSAPDGKLLEVFARTGKRGGCRANIEGLGRLVSVALRDGVSKDVISKQLRGIMCSGCIKSSSVKVLSCPDAIGRMLHELDTKGAMLLQGKNEECPECGAELHAESGCFSCMACGYSACDATMRR